MTIFDALMGFLLFSGAVTTPVTGDSAPIVPELDLHIVSLTAYNAVPWQTDDDPSVTASGAKSNPYVVAARSRDLAGDLPFGTIIELRTNGASDGNCGLSYVEHLIGYRVIADTMNARFTKYIDILFPEDSMIPLGSRELNAANVLGSCDNITIAVVGHVDISRPSNLPTSQAELAALVGVAHLALK